MNFILWKIIFFPLVAASIVNEEYKSEEDVYDAIINTFFPVFFIILFGVSGKTGPIKNVLLPLLDDLLYNTVTWVIPLIVSFAYDDLLSIKIFSIVNMGLHIICAIGALIAHKKVSEYDDFFRLIVMFLTFFPTIVIPIFWTVIITTRHLFDPISILFLTLFGILLATVFIFLILVCLSKSSEIADEATTSKVVEMIFIPGWFYLPNILQTLFIVLKWPIDFYFVKACVFILVLSLTRNVSFFTEKEPVPDDFLATSTTITQYFLRKLIDKNLEESENKIIDGTQKGVMAEMKESIMAEMKKIQKEEMEKSMAEMKETQTNESQKYETLKEEMKKSIAEMNKSMAERMDKMEKSRHIDEMV